MIRWFTRMSACAAILCLFAAPALAQNIILLDYSGFGWEDGGIPRSDPGDVLTITGVATSLDALFGVDLGVSEATVYIHSLVSGGEVFDPVSGFTFIGYNGGSIEVYEDSSNDHDWGVFPPNAQQATFTNGALLFSGDFTDFTLTLTSQGAGAYEGNIDGVGGTVAQLCDGQADCAYTFGGAFTKGAGAQLPDGYHLQIDGTLEVDAAVRTEPISFGAIKALYE
jgi:hypothetical protein